jgi:hypothetical protein
VGDVRAPGSPPSHARAATPVASVPPIPRNTCRLFNCTEITFFLRKK